MRCTLYDYECETCKIYVRAKNSKKRKRYRMKCYDCFLDQKELKEMEERSRRHNEYVNSREYLVDRLDELENRILEIESKLQ